MEKMKCGLRKLGGFDGYSCFADYEFANVSFALSVDKFFLQMKEYGSCSEIMFKILQEALGLYFFGPDFPESEAFDSKFHDFVLANFKLEEFCGEYVPYKEIRDQFCSRFRF